MLRLDSVNGGPVMEYRAISNQPVAPYAVTVQRRALSPDAEKLRDLGRSSEWRTVRLLDVVDQMRLCGPVAEWLIAVGISRASVVPAVAPNSPSAPAYIDIYDEMWARAERRPRR